jgi:hypothetical protein
MLQEETQFKSKTIIERGNHPSKYIVCKILEFGFLLAPLP